MILLEVKKLRRMRMGLLIFAIMAAVILMSVAQILGKAWCRRCYPRFL